MEQVHFLKSCENFGLQQQLFSFDVITLNKCDKMSLTLSRHNYYDICVQFGYKKIKVKIRFKDVKIC